MRRLVKKIENALWFGSFMIVLSAGVFLLLSLWAGIEHVLRYMFS